MVMLTGGDDGLSSRLQTHDLGQAKEDIAILKGGRE